MTYRLWLVSEETGQITLTGWSESEGAASRTKTDHWPRYKLCAAANQLPARLAELGIDLDAGADLSDLSRHWDCYVRHPDIAALRAQLDQDKSRV